MEVCEQAVLEHNAEECKMRPDWCKRRCADKNRMVECLEYCRLMETFIVPGIKVKLPPFCEKLRKQKKEEKDNMSEVYAKALKTTRKATYICAKGDKANAEQVC